jgi:C4-dicarboxylate-specific signal transduction histidine kinase
MSPGKSPVLPDRAERWLRLPVAFVLLAAVATADYLSGYEVRLAILYLAPIALATWVAGLAAGAGFAVAATLLWLVSFRAHHPYDEEWFYFWEGAVLLLGFLVLAWVVSRLRRALHQADERFYLVLENMPSAVFAVAERDDRILYANPATRRLLGLEPSMAANGVLTAMQAEAELPPDADPSLPSGSADVRIVWHTDSGRWFHWQRQSLPWGHRPDVRLHVLTDISTQKSAEQLRDQHSLLLHQATQLATSAEIASSLAHEINQPLMVIATYTDACRRLLDSATPDLDEVADVLKKCHAQAVRAATIIDRLRDFIRGRQHRAAACDLRSMLREVLDLLRPRFEAAGIAVDTHRVAGGILVLVDRVLVQQVLINLIRNALDAMADMPADRRKLELETEAPVDGRVALVVADYGIGLGDDVRDRMFTPFFSTKPAGLGLGLAISRSVAEGQGGALTAANRPEGGAAMRLILPMVPVP